MKVTINPSQELFVIEHTGGCSCLGFNNCFDDAAQMAGLLGTTKPDPKQKGTLDQYAEYQGLIRRYSARSDLNEQTWFDPGTPPSVVAHLEYARLHHRKLRLFFGDQTAGRCWLEENDVTGFIGRSMGPVRVPILASSGIFRCFFIGYHRSCLPALMDRQRPSPLQTRCKSPNSPMRKGVRLQIKQIGRAHV